MATFDTTLVAGFGPATYGMRLPLKSHHRADSDLEIGPSDIGDGSPIIQFHFGDNDYDLAKRLWKAGTEHRKWMRQVVVWVKITAPRFWWSEWDTYRIGTSANSESTMHTITKRSLLLEDFELPSQFINDTQKLATFTEYIAFINTLIEEYNQIEEMNNHKRQLFQSIKAMLPESFLQAREVCLNYEVLATMYKQRKNHRLPQWNQDFVNWVKTLPYSEFITGEFDKE